MKKIFLILGIVFIIQFSGCTSESNSREYDVSFRIEIYSFSNTSITCLCPIPIKSARNEMKNAGDPIEIINSLSIIPLTSEYSIVYINETCYLQINCTSPTIISGSKTLENANGWGDNQFISLSSYSFFLSTNSSQNIRINYLASKKRDNQVELEFYLNDIELNQGWSEIKFSIKEPPK